MTIFSLIFAQAWLGAQAWQFMLQLFGGRGYHPIIRVLSALFLIGWAVASWRLFLMTLDAVQPDGGLSTASGRNHL